MKYLAIETSSALCGVCVIEDEKLIDKIELENGLTHSQNLMPLIQELLEKNDIKISDLNGFICDIGPGSFTGIRIGVATAKAFVDSYENKRYTGVSSLDALAYNVKDNGLICSIIDCKNDNCYFALYNLENNNYIEKFSPTAASITEMLNTLAKYTNTAITFVGDGAIAYKKEISSNIPNAIFLNEYSNKISTYNLALAGYKKLINNQTLELLPMYLKKPQAERLLEEKGMKNGN